MRNFYLLRARYFNDGPPAVPPVPPPPPTPTMFTQDQVNKMMSEHKKKLQEERAQLAAQLEDIKQKSNLTEQEREELQTRIDTLNAQHMTKEQQLASEAANWKKKYESDTKQKEEEAKNWRSKFESLMINNAIINASTEHKAVSAKQMVLMLQGNAKVVDVLGDDGKPTGEFTVVTKVETVDPKTKQPVTIDMPISTALGELKKNENFFNLFERTDAGGLGGRGSARGGNKSGEYNREMTQEEYMAWRAEQKKSR